MHILAAAAAAAATSVTQVLRTYETRTRTTLTSENRRRLTVRSTYGRWGREEEFKLNEKRKEMELE